MMMMVPGLTPSNWIWTAYSTSICWGVRSLTGVPAGTSSLSVMALMYAAVSFRSGERKR